MPASTAARRLSLAGTVGVAVGVGRAVGGEVAVADGTIVGATDAVGSSLGTASLEQAASAMTSHAAAVRARLGAARRVSGLVVCAAEREDEGRRRGCSRLAAQQAIDR